MKSTRVAALAGMLALGSSGCLSAGKVSPSAQPGVMTVLPPPSARESGIKYMRDSEEYATLTRQVYRMAREAVERAAPAAGRSAWAVVLDVDETTLDNSVYQLERAAYAQPFDTPSWNAWMLRHEAGVVPGVVGFISDVRRLGGHVAWITNRELIAKEATRINLQQVGLWNDDDRLCMLDSPERPKRVRRAELIEGRGACAWAGTPMRLVAFIGDQMVDFPDSAEQIAGAGSDDAFGHVCFLLPNAMYGGWTSQPTRVR